MFDETISFINKLIKKYKLPYFECLVKKEGKEIFRFKYDKDNLKSNLLRMYSMSKPITAVAVLQLVEKGKINLNDNISKYIENMPELFLISNGSKVKKPITVHNLLSMTSGLDYNLDRPSIVKAAHDNKEISTLELCPYIFSDGLQFIPGTDIFYSLSFDVLAGIIEKASGMKFSSYIEKNIFKPLGMKESTFANDINFSIKTRNEFDAGDGSLLPSRPHYKWFFPSKNYESGGAGLISTVDDYSLFIDSLANRTNKIISDSSIDLMSKVYVENSPISKEIMNFSRLKEDYGYGYGVRVRKYKTEEGIPVGEFGWDGAAGSFLLCDRENNVSIVIGLNVFGWPSYLKDFHINISKLIYQEIKK